MNWTLVALLAIPGLMIGLLSSRGHTRGIEPYLWLVLAVFATLVIARTAGARYFLHGLSVGLSWGILNGLTAAALFPAYARNNPEIMRSIESGAGNFPPQAMFAIFAPVIGLATGLALGLLCIAATYLIQPAPPTEPFPPPAAPSSPERLST